MAQVPGPNFEIFLGILEPNSSRRQASARCPKRRCNSARAFARGPPVRIDQRILLNLFEVLIGALKQPFRHWILTLMQSCALAWGSAHGLDTWGSSGRRP